jgi:hypothetical protein
MGEHPDALVPSAIARRVVDELQRAHIPHAIGGALAYGYWGAARGTKDVDLNIFVRAAEASRVLTLLQAIGMVVDVAEGVRRAEEGAHVIGYIEGVAVDLFFNSIPLHASAERRAVTVDFLGKPARILTAEDLSILKLLFFRSKDKLDVERMLQLQGEHLDRGYVRRWLVEAVGEDDERVAVWDRYCRELPGVPR